METQVISNTPERKLVALREKGSGKLRVRQTCSYGGHSATLILGEHGHFVENGTCTIDSMFKIEPDRYEPVYTGDTVSITF